MALELSEEFDQMEDFLPELNDAVDADGDDEIR